MPGPISDHARIIDGKRLGPPKMPRRRPPVPPATPQTQTPPPTVSGVYPPAPQPQYPKSGF